MKPGQNKGSAISNSPRAKPSCSSIAAEGGQVTTSEIETGGQEPQFAAFVGIDWADQKHVWCLQGRDSTKRENGELKHTPEAVEAWVAQLCQRFGNRPIAVALEQSRGSLVFMLAKYEPLHLFPVSSTMSASMRKALYPSGSKDDPRDADVFSICCCNIATSCAVCRRTPKPRGEYKTWWRNDASWWMRRQSTPIV